MLDGYDIVSRQTVRKGKTSLILTNDVYITYSTIYPPKDSGFNAELKFKRGKNIMEPSSNTVKCV